MTDTTENKKANKKNLTMYWGVELDISLFETCEQIRDFLENNKDIIPQKAIHSTLLFVGMQLVTINLYNYI
jgi:hypothetical protein